MLQGTKTPKYRIEASYIRFTTKTREIQSFAWDSKSYGKPTLENLAKFRMAFNKSLEGHNKHLAHIMSGLSNISLIEQKTGQTILKYVPPMFEVI
jgi:hypothetical protein